MLRLVSGFNNPLGADSCGSVSPRAVLIENEISRYQSESPLTLRALRPHFSPRLEKSFRTDVGPARLRELRLTTGMGIGFYFMTVITDPVFLPKLGLLGLLYRGCTLPMLLAIFFLRSTSAIIEEVGALSALIAISLLAILPALSSGPLAVYGYGTAILGMIYGNTTYPLRFYQACVVTVICCAMMISGLALKADLELGLRYSIILQICVGGAFSLIACYRIERSARLTYLLAARDSLRVKALVSDRETLSVLSNTDALTGIANRGFFDRQSAAVLSSPSNSGRDIALLMLDVDYFKRFNDHYGHVAGDACLQVIARTVSNNFRDKDAIVARYGGEEFAILLMDITSSQAKAIGDRICKSVQALGLKHDNREDCLSVVTVSIGGAIMMIGDQIASMEALIQSADRSLYAAKREGRNRFATDFASVA